MKRKPERMKGPRTKSGALTAKERKKSATITEHKKGPRGGSTRARFPMPDVEHARLALADLPRAKGLSAAEKRKIRDRAHRIIDADKSKSKGGKKSGKK